MDDWELIESPDDIHQLHSSPPPTPTSPLAAAAIRDNSAVFPPYNHEGLDLDDPSSKLVAPPPSSPLSSTSSSSEAAPSRNGLSGASARSILPGGGIERRSGVRGIVRRAWDRVWFGFSVWKLLSTAGVVGVVAAAALVYVKVVMRRRRSRRSAAVGEVNKNHLVLLIKDKDQVINGHDSFSNNTVKILSGG